MLSDPKMTLWGFGHAVEMMQLKAALLVQKWSINLPNGLTRKLKSTSMISPEDQILIDL